MWRWAFVWTGLIGLIFALLVVLIREPRRNQADEENWANEVAAAPHGVSLTPTNAPVRVTPRLSSLLRVKSFVVLTLIGLFTSFNAGASATYLPTLLQQNDTFAFKSGTAALYTGIGFAVAGVAGVVLGGYLSDALRSRFPGARVLICGIGLLIGAPAYALAVVGAVIHNLILFTIFFLLATLLNQMYIGPSNAAALDVVPSAIRASALAVSGFVAALLGGAFAPSIVGFLAGVFDPTHGQHFLHNSAGLDLTYALLVTCVPCLFVGGVLGVIGARWVKTDMLTAEQQDKLNI
jgi:MFS family permease